MADINEHEYDLVDSDIDKEPLGSWNGNEIMEKLKHEVYKTACDDQDFELHSHHSFS